MADGPAPDAVAYAVAYTFGHERTYYQRLRRVWDVDVLLRALSAEDTQAADLAASRVPSDGAAYVERQLQCLARSVVAIDGQEYAGTYTPGDESPAGLDVLRGRLEHLHGLPARLAGRLYAAFLAVQDEFDALMGDDRLGESSPVAGENGAS